MSNNQHNTVTANQLDKLSTRDKMLIGSAAVLFCISAGASGSVLASSIAANPETYNPCYGSQSVVVEQDEQLNQVAAELSATGIGNAADISEALQYYNQGNIAIANVNGNSVYVFAQAGDALAPNNCLVSTKADD